MQKHRKACGVAVALVLVLGCAALPVLLRARRHREESLVRRVLFPSLSSAEVDAVMDRLGMRVHGPELTISSSGTRWRLLPATPVDRPAVSRTGHLLASAAGHVRYGGSGGSLGDLPVRIAVYEFSREAPQAVVKGLRGGGFQSSGELIAEVKGLAAAAGLPAPLGLAGAFSVPADGRLTLYKVPPLGADLGWTATATVWPRGEGALLQVLEQDFGAIPTTAPPK